ncbi:hypothetical protein [Streptomyces sp. NPDC046805]|uniref:hypothetical protein n=1 Tax=Streptomyces sp. NPDC046805 TaxID=3155134 RepID=UPI0033C0792D
MRGIGPLEPVDPAEAQDSHDVIGRDPTRLGERRHALRPGLRRGAVTAATALVLTGVALLTSRTAASRTAPLDHTPYPANVTEWSYLGLAAPPAAHATSGRFRFAVTVDAGPPVTLQVTGAAFAGLAARATPEPRFTVTAKTTRRITVEISAADCSTLSLNEDLPFLDVTLRSKRAIQHHSFIFGRALSRDLSRLLHGACDRPHTPPGQLPTGSAHSYPADRSVTPPKPNRTSHPRTRRPGRHNKSVTSQRTAIPMSVYRA